MKSKYFVIAFSALILTELGCKKLVEVQPPVTELTSNNVYINNATASAVLTGIYNTMSSSSGGSFAAGNNSISVEAGLSADELQGTVGASLNSSLGAFYLNSLNGNNSGITPWSQIYQYIQQENAAIAGLTASTTLTTSIKQELIGEAKFLRAFDYFYLTNLFGNVPLALSNDYTANESLPSSTQSQIYKQVVADLISAQGLLSKNYLMADAATVYPIGSAERVRPNYYAATALLARVYLYNGDYIDAITTAGLVIGNTSLYSLSPLTGASSVFMKNSSEAIWQLQPTNSLYCTPDGQFFIMTAAPPASAVWLNNNLVNAFEPGDQRKVNWIGAFNSGTQTYYYPYKYQVKTAAPGPTITEYTMVFRLAEQYLIRAEAEADNNDPADAVNDLNAIRNRAGLPNYVYTTKSALLSTIYHERQVELFTEWGNRWLDLKRTGNVNTVMSTIAPQKGGTWNPDWALWPIYQNDILTDPKLTQNPGY